MARRRWMAWACIAGPLALCGATWFYPSIFRGVRHVQTQMSGQKTIGDRLEQYGPEARKRLAPHFARAGVPYPPARLVLVGLKQSRQLLLYAGPAEDAPRFIRGYPILGASGALGPKLREGDRQVPEGLYRIELLNPNSRFHLSLRIDYPNEFDRAQAQREGRTNLGGDIMIHGGESSIGCLAMGDPATEELFVLAADTGLENISVILAPVDFRVEPAPHGKNSAATPSWTPELYAQIKATLAKLPPAE